MRTCSTCRLAICVDCFFAKQCRTAYRNQSLTNDRRVGGQSGEKYLRRPDHTKAKLNARIAVIELRSLLVADAPISLARREYLVSRACGLARTPERRAWATERLKDLIEQRFGRNPETFQPSQATQAALHLLSMLQEGNI
ncbi:hypothetical protein ASD50_19640 [Mesorhizobium sp. Root552]|nr:hypothetical protein ASD50_19640 [Mesorhizobium sp. Root552]